VEPINIKTEHLDLHGLKFGTGEEVVIALHGWLDNCHSFYPMLNSRLVSQTWYCIDLVGHGKSSWRSNDAHYYFVDYIDDLYQLIKALKCKKVHLVGHSMGAMIAGLFASCFSEYVKSVCFIEGLAAITTPSNEVSNQLKNAIVNREKLRTKLPRVYKTKETLYQARSLSTDLTTAHIVLIMERNISSVTDGYILTSDPKLKNPSGFRFNESQCIGAIKKITAPCLLITGEQGYPFVKQNLSKYSKYYNNLKVETVAGGHHCHMQSSELCFEHVHAFIVQNSAC
jgi:pimeloyl-ACP methyl ester carboxylesterase